MKRWTQVEIHGNIQISWSLFHLLMQMWNVISQGSQVRLPSSQELAAIYTISMCQKICFKKEIQELSVSQEISGLRRELFNTDL